MSSTRRPQGRAGGPPPERKAPAGPVLTPQILMVVYFIILLIGGIWYYNSVIKKSQEQLAAASARVTTAQTAKKTYDIKRGKLDMARHLNTSMRDKLRDVAYRFMTDQTSMLPFWEETFFPILDASRLTQTEDSKIKSDVYTFHINMAMDPFNTLPRSAAFDNEDDVFKIAYHPEQNGQPIDTPLDTRPTDFLSPYSIEMVDWAGTYEDVEDFIRRLQEKQNKTLFTVHCYKNKEDKNVYS